VSLTVSIGKPPNIPAGKARADEENRRMNRMSADDLSNPSGKEVMRMNARNMARVGKSPDERSEETQIGGSRPGVRSRVREALARLEDRGEIGGAASPLGGPEPVARKAAASTDVEEAVPAGRGRAARGKRPAKKAGRAAKSTTTRRKTTARKKPATAKTPARSRPRAGTRAGKAAKAARTATAAKRGAAAKGGAKGVRRKR
jgi:hypothetical protein